MELCVCVSVSLSVDLSKASAFSAPLLAPVVVRHRHRHGWYRAGQVRWIGKPVRKISVKNLEKVGLLLLNKLAERIHKPLALRPCPRHYSSGEPRRQCTNSSLHSLWTRWKCIHVLGQRHLWKKLKLGFKKSLQELTYLWEMLHEFSDVGIIEEDWCAAFLQRWWCYVIFLPFSLPKTHTVIHVILLRPFVTFEFCVVVWWISPQQVLKWREK